jgi:hypothetical protein
VPTGGRYGEAQALRQQQQAAPMAATSPVAGGIAPQAANPAGAFGPSTRPSEPITAGTVRPGTEAVDSKEILRMIYAAYPSPWIASLLSD